MYLHENHTINVRITTSRNSCKKLIAHHLHNHGYYQVKHTPGIWRHVRRPISFTFLVVNFGVGYVGRENVDHLMSALKIYYDTIKTDWEGKLYCGIKMK